MKSLGFIITKDKTLTLTLERLETFVSENEKSIERLLEDAKIHNADVDTVDTGTLFDIGLDVMLDIYCTRGWKFDAEKFQTAMEKMELRPIHAHKLFSAIEKWRRQCEPVPTSVSQAELNHSFVKMIMKREDDDASNISGLSVIINDPGVYPLPDDIIDSIRLCYKGKYNAIFFITFIQYNISIYHLFDLGMSGMKPVWLGNSPSNPGFKYENNETEGNYIFFNSHYISLTHILF
jgi:hypothetical protein